MTRTRDFLFWYRGVLSSSYNLKRISCIIAEWLQKWFLPGADLPILMSLVLPYPVCIWEKKEKWLFHWTSSAGNKRHCKQCEKLSQICFIWGKGKPNSPSNKALFNNSFLTQKLSFFTISLVTLGAKQAYRQWSDQHFTAVILTASTGREDDLAVQYVAWIILGCLSPVDLDYSKTGDRFTTGKPQRVRMIESCETDHGCVAQVSF